MFQGSQFCAPKAPGRSNDVTPSRRPDLTFASQLGAQTMFTVRMLMAPEKAAEMGETYKHRKEICVQFWSIGNEPTYTMVSTRTGMKRTMSIVSYRMAVIAAAMKIQIQPLDW
jgi:hypothetical protein